MGACGGGAGDRASDRAAVVQRRVLESNLGKLLARGGAVTSVPGGMAGRCAVSDASPPGAQAGRREREPHLCFLLLAARY